MNIPSKSSSSQDNDSPLSPLLKSTTPKISSPLKNPPMSLSQPELSIVPSKRRISEVQLSSSDNQKEPQPSGILRQANDPDRKKSLPRRVSFAANVRLRHIPKSLKKADEQKSETQPKKNDQSLHFSDNITAKPNLESINVISPIFPAQVPQTSYISITPQPSTKSDDVSFATPTDIRENEKSVEETGDSFELPLKGGSQSTPHISSDRSFLEANNHSNSSLSQNLAFEPFKSISPIDPPSFVDRASNKLDFELMSNQRVADNLNSTPYTSMEPIYNYYGSFTPTPATKRLKTEPAKINDLSSKSEEAPLTERYRTPEVFLSDSNFEFNSELSNNLKLPDNPDVDKISNSNSSTVSKPSLSSQSSPLMKTSDSTQNESRTDSPNVSQTNTTFNPNFKLSKLKEKDADSDTSTPQQISSIISLYDNLSPVNTKLEVKPEPLSSSTSGSSQKLTTPKHSITATSMRNELSHKNEIHTPFEKTQEKSPNSPLLFSGKKKITSPSIASMVRELDPIAHHLNLKKSLELKEKTPESRGTYLSKKEVYSSNDLPNPPSYNAIDSHFLPSAPYPPLANTSSPFSTIPILSKENGDNKKNIKPSISPISTTSREEVISETLFISTTSISQTKESDLCNMSTEKDTFSIAPSSFNPTLVTREKPIASTETSLAQHSVLPYSSPFKEPQTPSRAKTPALYTTSVIKGTPLSVRKHTPLKLSQTPSALTTMKIEYQPPVSPSTERAKRMLKGLSWKDTPFIESSPTSSVSWMDEVDATDLMKEKMPFSQETERDLMEPPKTLQELLHFLGSPLVEDFTIPQLPLKPGKGSYVFTSVTADWPILAFRHRSCQQMLNFIQFDNEEIKSKLATPIKPKVLKDLEEHWNNPYLKDYSLKKLHAIVHEVSLLEALKITQWWIQQLLELESVFHRTWNALKNDDKLLSEKLNSISLTKELLEEKVERDTETNLKEQAQHQTEMKKQQKLIAEKKEELDAMNQKKILLMKEVELARKELEMKKQELKESQASTESIQLEIAEMKKKKESIKFYTMEDFHRFKHQREEITKTIGWAILPDGKRKGREHWRVYQSLFGLIYLNALKAYFDLSQSEWTLVRTEAHQYILPAISEIVDLLPSKLPSPKMPLAQITRWIARRWDWLWALNQRILDCTPKYLVDFKYDHATSKIHFIHKCFKGRQFRVDVHLYVDVWNSSLTSAPPPLDYEVQVKWGNVPSRELYDAIKDALEENDIRAIFAAIWKVLEENN